MTNWLPDLATLPGPRYLAIADALAADVREGRLAAGTRLPTHRDLAWHLHVTVGTVSRAYAEAERRGLIAGEVGRGTFVRPAGGGPLALPVRLRPEPAGFIDLGSNFPIVGEEPALFAKTLAALSSSNTLAELLHYQPHTGRQSDREAGAEWVRRTGLATDADRIVVTGGGQHAIASVLGALTQSGDTIAAECLTYPGLKALATLLNLRVVPIVMDEEGLLPDALAAAAKAQRIKALYTVPTLQNPTASVMPLDRRRAIARIAEENDIALVEDDVYGFLVAEAPLPIAAFAPAHGFYVTSASKSIAPGLRIGYVHAPEDKLEKLAAAMRATTHMATPLMAEIVSRWVRDGTADRLVAAKRDAAVRRQAMVRRLFAGAALRTHPFSFHVWLTLPETWRAEDFVAAARRRHVGLTPAVAFAVGRTPPPNAVRLCIGPPASDETLERALRLVTDLLAEVPEPYLSVV
jgi:DNA-binding transcriptional MocR family regulator